MDVRRVPDPREFLDAASQLLLSDEPRHNLLFGVTSHLIDVPGTYPEFHLWVVEDEGETVEVALMTPPFNLLIARPAHADALEALAADLVDEGISPPGVTGAVPEVEGFVEAWERTTGATSRRRMAQGIYQLSAVSSVGSVPGGMRRATGADRDLVRSWVRAFTEEALDESAGDRSDDAFVDRRLEGIGGKLYLWEDGRPVSLAGHSARTPNGVRVGPVYTPPELRRRGYASALVAALSASLIADGNRFCFLYTDMANPTSNRIYQAIGYRFVCSSADYAFEPAS
jgi:predicted GNAT family acetyltransferase